jgi:hypothetical protein
MTKVFNPGEILTAADVNTYLVNTTGSGNAIINGAFDFWQRGTSASAAAATYLADRWVNQQGGSGTYTASQQSFTPAELTGPPIEPTFYHRVAYTPPAPAASNFAFLNQAIEGVRTFAGQTVTLSYYAKADSTKSIAVGYRQDFGSGGSTAVSGIIAKQALTTTWTRYTHTFTVPSISGKTLSTGATVLGLRFIVSSGGNIFADGLGEQSITFDIWGVQLEAGTVATPFKRNANSLQGELAACQRYYQRIGGVVHQGYLASLTGISTTAAQGGLLFAVQMRSAPAASSTGDFVIRQGSGTLSNPVTSIAFSAAYPQGILFSNANVASGMVAGDSVYIRSEGATLGFLEFSAEL